ncbi:MAG: NAD(P)H-dependent oxidoreductase subunit E [Fimbriimonadaceae bacterium]
MSELIKLSNGKGRPTAPRADQLELKFSPKAVGELEALKGHYPDLKSLILPGLWIAQREHGGHLPPEALAEVAYRLSRSYAEVEGVATFYSMYNTDHAVGRHMIEVCTCLTCHMCGAYKLADYLKQKLGVGFGETTEDGVFTLHEVECLDACDRAPVFQVGEEYLGPMDESGVDALLDRLRKAPGSSVVKLADEVVKVHLGSGEPS